MLASGIPLVTKHRIKKSGRLCTGSWESGRGFDNNGKLMSQTGALFDNLQSTYRPTNCLQRVSVRGYRAKRGLLTTQFVPRAHVVRTNSSAVTFERGARKEGRGEGGGGTLSGLKGMSIVLEEREGERGRASSPLSPDRFC